MTGGRDRYYAAPKIKDWGALDAAVDVFIADQGQAAATARNHKSGWKTWESHCLVRGVDPAAAPFSAFEDLLLRRRADGHCYTRGSHDTVLAAVSAVYSAAGVVPAHQRPENKGTWRMLMSGAARDAQERKRAHPGSAEQWEVKPLLREPLIALLTTTPATTVRTDACVASVLLALDGGLSARELARLEPREVGQLPEGAIRVGGLEHPCDHVERVRGVPWDCTACAVRLVMSQHPGTGPLFVAASEGDAVVAMSQRLAGLRDRPWAGVPTDRSSSTWRSTRLTAAPGLRAWEAAGFRRACVLTVGRRGEGGTWLRARAWTALAWSCGFRMCGDLLRLDRSSVTTDRAEAGYRIELGGTKDDPRGEKQIVRPVAWAEGQISVASMLTEYLCVRDAVHGPRGLLIVKEVLSGRNVDGRGISDAGRGSGGGTRAAGQDLRLLGELAGLSDVRYSSYSTRKGFAMQCLADGWSVEAIRDALRHQTLGKTLNAYLAPSEARAVSTKLIGRLGRASV